VGIPVFACTIVDPEVRTIERSPAAFSGFGCHPSKEIALIQAITEAAQCRLTHISGSRDDIFRNSLSVAENEADASALIRALELLEPSVDFRRVPSAATNSLDDDVSTELRALSAAGFEQVIVVDLTIDSIGIPVVRVVIPGMEFKLHHDRLPKRPSARTWQRL